MAVEDEGDTNITRFDLAERTNQYFELSIDGRVTVKEGVSFDYEEKKSYSMAVTATNSIGVSVDKRFSVRIKNIVDVIPILNDTNITIVENIENGSKIGKINFKNSGDDDHVDIKIVNSKDSNFTFDSKGNIIVDDNATIDYETLNDYNFTITAENGAGVSESATLHINIEDYLNPFLVAKFQSNIQDENDTFGSSVAVYNDYIAVGAPNESSDRNNSGAIYLFKKSKDEIVTQIAKVKASNAGESDLFGTSVAIYGRYIVAGAINEDDDGSNSGAAYLFKIDNDDSVEQIAKLKAKDAEEGDLFGSKVSIYEKYIAVSSPKEDTTATDAGSVYIFKIDSDDSVSQIDKLQASDASKNDLFGTSITIFKEYIVVGAPYNDTTEKDAGSIYIFKKDSDDNITQIHQVQSDDIEEDDKFGYSLSMYGDYIAVGAPFEDSEEENAGSGYLFKKDSDDNITQVEKFHASNADVNDSFALSIGVYGEYVVSLSPNEDTSNKNAGMLYIYKIDKNDDLQELKKLQSSDKQKNSGFNTLAINRNNIVV
jgi:hypothetical protein